VITFANESSHASWQLLFKGNGVAPYKHLYMDGLMRGQVVCSLETNSRAHIYMGSCLELLA
jgi:hypothetical protein